MGKLYVVATPIGNLDDISVRAKDVLSHVTWIAAEDTRHSRVLLDHLGIATPLVSYHDYNEQERVEKLIKKLQQGETGALISDAGTPLISDPGFHLVAAAHDAHIQVVPIPGPCSLIAALSAAGLPTDKFLFEGFLPAKENARRKRLEALKEFAHTMVFFEAPHRLAELVKDCHDIFSGQRLATLVRELTKKFETIHRDPLENLLALITEEKLVIKGECILVVQGAKVEENRDSNQVESERILRVLLAEVPLKQAVQIAVKITHQPKNWLYDLAMKLK
ncbi:MAG: 16S rRNA (cytidine(1402)-2'-O)-methyltransferase [Proteobacteria bacterium]|nr:16S rRNA (cytidine(1402)-2'-O)-methyltransferase [Pseudomonadota bacterium]